LLTDVHFANGKEVENDYKQAVYWYKKSAEQGIADAKKRLKELENKL
jgi:TPR repeat protein